MLLAIDTSAGTSVAIVDPSTRAIVVERSTPDTMRHAEVIGTLLAEALSFAGIRPSALDGVVVGMGPGPFTGLRVGIAAARTFALGAGLPLHPMVSADAVARQEALTGASDTVMVVTDARRKEVFWSLYDLSAAEPVRLDGPGLAKPDALPHSDARRVDAAEIPAAQLALAAAGLLAAGLPLASDEALYLRSPDVTMPSGIKRVTQ
ncbi:tRNA (adenosine(37)-N6)-threonylcarbamoyltransferase complex dimerization subunit type 1 TsaB [Agreia pratensis]|uniref:tRNA (adenosine(37)-N6)-threonylcarbamoyltransferase complex dimerization subunit type 1 TsaB n=1 Tax=Agreia pratensis TaxID=150121 RepID=UPI00188D21BE|nr:tRNA (adenosine(37)-N6)-threonylcarbamoyltransferase complex dimerization subunit type 1 TsaB [Agreia pratensis]MBF4635455.1 tRNA (adenosine(37)-N6)-threonylcarbamoyltransferase complex dimerization subunit type 1 TsaB [Agreia pratensis]